ncbi:MAG TPA: preprotein translocase subunit YajC [Candidatus Hydrothermia bacterium]|nr:preprotein translocase subunit YajC [Candidatus Hydrothermia bacterium]HPO78641.1 preprotein translocase subunit YajC [Candidatus Hydrothermia bacterium]
MEVLMQLLVCNVDKLYAQAQQAPSGGSSLLGALLPLILIFVLFYVILILPQSRYEKKRKQMLSSLKKGDKIVTSGGIIGVIQKIDENIVTVKVADNVNIKIEKQAVKGVLEKGSEEE